MSDEEALEFYNKLVEHFGDSLANFEHYPKQFQNQVKLFRYYEEQRANRSRTNSDLP